MHIGLSDERSTSASLRASVDLVETVEVASSEQMALTGRTTQVPPEYHELCTRTRRFRQSSFTDDTGLSHDDSVVRSAATSGSQDFFDHPGSAQSPRGSVDLTPRSPSHGVWLTEPPSIDEPLVLLDEEEEQLQARERVADAISQLRAELAQAKEDVQEAKANSKADRAALEAKESGADIPEQERNKFLTEQLRLETDNKLLRLQLQDHHGIMAADWEQTICFRERLHQEEAACERLSEEVAVLRENIGARIEEATSLRADAGLWRVLCNPDAMKEATATELDKLLDVASSAMGPLHFETRNRTRAVKLQLSSELEQQLCVVCRDTKKAVLFLPCQHVCVCEGCRGRLRPYRCPLCQEPVQSHIERVHF